MLPETLLVKFSSVANGHARFFQTNRTRHADVLEPVSLRSLEDSLGDKLAVDVIPRDKRQQSSSETLNAHVEVRDIFSERALSILRVVHRSARRRRDRHLGDLQLRWSLLFQEVQVRQVGQHVVHGASTCVYGSNKKNSGAKNRGLETLFSLSLTGISSIMISPTSLTASTSSVCSLCGIGGDGVRKKSVRYLSGVNILRARCCFGITYSLSLKHVHDFHERFLRMSLC
ncbi:hypothetical protein DSLPV1_206 [Dishui lake phycodnavirus 1]|uniref:hypothetical protein n=1 Tax=Dishui lake phycodnavirus 1 TaxID=2079134 RepID=UPI000CD67500|nr:hypothetical protein C5Y57_gp192 [Dishui lake phycodnavirus 1]AUT19177.1 hypothetical protein DSLPV1_206 [Dishui lake phycodnavirus 1]